MSLRFRLSLLVALTSLAGLLFFGLLAYGLFVRQQVAQLELLLERDLARAQQLFSEPEVGASFSELGADGFTQQFVNPAGEVTIPPGEADALLLAETPTLVRLAGRPALIAAVPWETGSGLQLGTIRAALDMSSALAARRVLAGSLAASGLLIGLASLFTGLGVLRRALRPLNRLAAEARQVDPASPRLARYSGPQDEVGDVADALNAALESVRARQAEERASLAEIAHELAAPLTLVAGHLDTLGSRVEDPALDVARSAARELLYTSQDLLSLARGELEQVFTPRAVDLNELLTQLAAAYPGVELLIEGPAKVAGSPERLVQMLRNVVRNAVQASERPEEVEVRLEPGLMHHIHVVDQGPGIPAADLPHIFDRFYTKRGGAGVGLSVAKRIAKTHGGDIEVVSETGAGAHFTVTLPSLEAQIVKEPEV